MAGYEVRWNARWVEVVRRLYRGDDWVASMAVMLLQQDELWSC